MNVLVIVAHPDDPEFFAGATIAKWVAEGHAVRYLIVTGGDKGNDDPGRTVDRLVAMREIEQTRAAEVLGVTDITFLRYRDGELANTLALQRELVREVRAFRPDIIVTTDHQTVHYGGSRINHNDHRVIGLAVCDSVFPASGNRMFFPDLLGAGYEMHMPREVWFSGTTAPNVFVDVSEHLERKARSVREHVSQVRDPNGISARMHQNALRIMADGSRRFVESFRRILI